MLKAMHVSQGADAGIILGRSHKGGRRRVATTVEEDNLRRMNTSVRMNEKFKEVFYATRVLLRHMIAMLSCDGA